VGATCLECAPWPNVLVSARAAVVMEPPANALVHALKYGGWHSLGEVMGRRMASVCPPPERDSVVVPIPTTSSRRRTRGYNQARVLADVVARELGLAVEELLERPKGGTQVRSGPRERRSNVQGSFRVVPSSRSRFPGLRVILVDDVLTTGATALSAASSLGEKGVESVHLLTFARALPFGGEKRRLPLG
jgi:ComF family protein